MSVFVNKTTVLSHVHADMLWVGLSRWPFECFLHAQAESSYHDSICV